MEGRVTIVDDNPPVERVLICGSRTYPEDDPMVVLVLEGINEMHKAGQHHPMVIEGGCPTGADKAARDWVAGWEWEYPHKSYPPDWSRLGKSAGPRRNKQMLEEGQPDMVVAFIDKSLEMSRGTADMVERARRAKVPTYVIQRMP